MGVEDDTTNTGQGQAEPAAFESPGPATLVDQQDSLIGPGKLEQDEAEQQFQRTCRKIREIEQRARHSLRPEGLEHFCSFCNRPRSEVGSLCQPDNLDVCICLECAESALELLRGQND